MVRHAPGSAPTYRCAALLLAILLTPGCTVSDSGSSPLTAEVPLRLERHLDAATVEGSEVPEDLPDPVEWRFDEPQPGWQPVEPIAPQWDAVEPVRVDDALRLPLTARHRANGPRLAGEIYVTLPDWNLEDWAYVEIRARTADPMGNVGVDFNYTEEDPFGQGEWPLYSEGDSAPLVTDGTVQTYRLSLDDPSMRRWEGPWTHLAIWFASQADEEEVTLDILSVSVIPSEAYYADAPAGTRQVRLVNGSRPAIYSHTPGRIGYRVVVPPGGVLDVGLGVARQGVPVTFRVHAEPEGGGPETLLQETYADNHRWVQHSIDLSPLVGQTVTLTLEADAQRPGTVALWAIPTLRETPTTDSGSYRVLFLGNSTFHAYGGIYQPFEGFCAAAGLDCEAVTQGGQSVSFEHGIEWLGYGRISNRLLDVARTEWIHSLIESGNFDYVILNLRRPGWFLPDWLEDAPEFEGRPQDPYEETLAALTELHRTIVESGAQPVLMAQPLVASLLHWTHPLNQIVERLGADLERVEINGERHPVPVVPVLSLLLDGVNRFGVEEWFFDDPTHPGQFANYANACLVFTYLTGRDPRQNPFRDLGHLWGWESSRKPLPVEQVSEEAAAWIKNQVWLYYTTRRR